MYFPKSQIKTNLYTTGQESNILFLDPLLTQVYKGYYYHISTGKKYTGREPGDGENFILFENTFSKFSKDKDEISNSFEIMNPLNGIVSIPIETVPTDENGNLIEEPSTPLNIEYYNLLPSNTPKHTLLPQPFTTLPTTQDYKNGKMVRYFAKKTNELRYLEISKQTFQLLNSRDNRILWSLYEPAQIQWIISGFEKQQVNDYNTIIVRDIERKKKWNGFSKFLKEDYTKYYKNLSA